MTITANSDNWDWLPLGEICQIVNGATPKTKHPEFWGGEIVWFTPKDLGANRSLFISQSARTLTPDGLASTSTRLMPPGTTYLSTGAPIGHLAFSTVEAAPGTRCKALFGGEALDPLFLAFALRASVARLSSFGRGSKFAEISKRQLAEFEIPYVDLGRQREISRILEKTIDIAKIAHEQSEATKLLVDALLYDLIPSHRSSNEYPDG